MNADSKLLDSNTRERSKSEPLTTDFRRFVKRRFQTVQIPTVGPVRLRTLTASELTAVRNFSPVDQYYAAIALSVVNEDGDCEHTCDEESFAYMRDMQAKVYDALVDAINHFSLNQISFRDMVKNSNGKANGVPKSALPDDSTDGMSTSS